MVSPVSVGVGTGLLLGLSAIFFSAGSPLLGAVALTVGIVLGVWGGIKFFGSKG